MHPRTQTPRVNSSGRTPDCGGSQCRGDAISGVNLNSPTLNPAVKKGDARPARTIPSRRPAAHGYGETSDPERQGTEAQKEVQRHA